MSKVAKVRVKVCTDPFGGCCTYQEIIKPCYHQGTGKFQKGKRLLDDYYANQERVDYDVKATEHAARVLYTGMRNLYSAYYREGLDAEQAAKQGVIYGFTDAAAFAKFADKHGLGAVAFYCSFGNHHRKDLRESMLEDAMTQIIRYFVVCQ